MTDKNCWVPPGLRAKQFKIIHHWDDDQGIRTYIDDVETGHANHDDDGWAGIEQMQNQFEAMAKALGVEVVHEYLEFDEDAD